MTTEPIYTSQQIKRTIFRKWTKYASTSQATYQDYVLAEAGDTLTSGNIGTNPAAIRLANNAAEKIQFNFDAKWRVRDRGSTRRSSVNTNPRSSTRGQENIKATITFRCNLNQLTKFEAIFMDALSAGGTNKTSGRFELISENMFTNAGAVDSYVRHANFYDSLEHVGTTNYHVSNFWCVFEKMSFIFDSGKPLTQGAASESQQPNTVIVTLSVTVVRNPNV